MIERPLRTGCRLGWCWPTARMRQLRVRRRVRCEGLGYAVGFTVRHGVAPDCWGRRIGDPWRIGDLADAHRARWLRRVTWREGTKGKMSSRFATERVVLAGRPR